MAPQRPKLEYEGQHILPGNNVTVDSGATATVKCISHYGNPPAILKWYLGDQEIAPLHLQANSTEPDNPRTWSAASVVQIPSTKERHGLILKCLAFHEYYSARTVSVESRMDVRCKLYQLNDSRKVKEKFKTDIPAHLKTNCIIRNISCFNRCSNNKTARITSN